MTDESPVRAPPPHLVEYGEIPEIARTLRAFGSLRRGGALQSQFFAPLVEARRRGAEARTPAARIRAFDGTALRRAVDSLLERILSDWPDQRTAARRALRAELLERIAPYSQSLDALGERAVSALKADQETRLAAWRDWAAQLAATYESADRAWMAMKAVVEQLAERAAANRSSREGRST